MKIRNILSSIILILILTLTVGFSAFVSEMSISNLVAEVRVQKDVRITNVQFLEDESWNVVSNSVDYDEDSLIGNVTFNDFDAVASYKVTFTNFGNVKVYADVSKYTGSISATPLDAMGVVEPLGGTFEVIMLVSPEEIKTESFNIDFSFRRIFNLIYDGVSGTNEEIMEGETYFVFLGEDVCDYIEIYMDGVLLDESKYDTSYGQLTISNVTGDVIIKERERVAKVVSGDLTTVGSEVCIKDECFYIIGNDGTTISMLSKYNLNVGYEVTASQTGNALSNPTKIQSPDAIGYKLNKSQTAVSFPFIGTTGFATSSYWDSSVTTYPAYVYSYNSIPYNHIIDYRVYLNNNGLRTKNLRLIKSEELESLGCSMSNWSCTDAPSWVYSTSYWTGTAKDYNYIWRVDTGGYFACNSFNNYFDVGVRPVVEIAASEVSDYITFTVGGVTYRADKDMTWEEWIESEYGSSNFYYNVEQVLVGAGSLVLLNSSSVNRSDRIISGGTYSIESGHHAGGSND